VNLIASAEGHQLDMGTRRCVSCVDDEVPGCSFGPKSNHRAEMPKFFLLRSVPSPPADAINYYRGCGDLSKHRRQQRKDMMDLLMKRKMVEKIPMEPSAGCGVGAAAAFVVSSDIFCRRGG